MTTAVVALGCAVFFLGVLLVFQGRAHAEERRYLLGRIQSPQVAVARDAQGEAARRPPVPQPGIFNDAEMKAARELREGKSK